MLEAFRFITVAAIAPLLPFTHPAIAQINDTEGPIIPEVATVLPSNTAYTILLDMRPATWQQLEAYSFFQVLEAQGEGKPNPGGLPFLPPDLDYEADIAPWVGDTTAIALLPLDRPRTTVIEEHEILVAPIAQADAFTGFVNTVTDLRTTLPKQQAYAGVSILYWEPVFETPKEAASDGSKALPADDGTIMVPDQPEPDVPGLAIAVLPDFLIAAEDPAAIRAWIDLRPADATTSLATESRFQRTLAHPEYDGALGTFYGNLGEIVKYSLTDFTLPDLPFELPMPDNISPEEIAALASQQLDSSIEVLIYPQPEGIRLQGRGYFDESILPTLQTSQAVASPEVLNHVPAPTYVMFSGQNLAAAWEETATTLEATEDTQTYLEQARIVFQLATGLDLDEDFFGWMDEGFSLFVFPTRQTPLTLFTPELQIGVGIALQTSDRPAAEAALAKIEAQLGGSAFTVQPQMVNGQTVSNWTIDLDEDGRADSFLGHGWVSDDTLVVTTSLGSLSEIMNLYPRQTLPGSPIFRRAIQGFPENNQGYFYTNISSTLSLISSFLPTSSTDQEFADLRKALGTVQTLTSTFSVTEEYIQLDGLVMMSPAR